MVFTDIRLQNYRSYKDSSYELGGGVTIVVGPNAAGKSNLVEGLLLAATGKAYRGKAGLIKKGSKWARIDVHTTENTTRTVKITAADREEAARMEFAVNDKLSKRLPARLKQPAVLFEPNDLVLMHGEPQRRREYIDNLSSQLESHYSQVLSRYKRTLTQRNALLKAPALDKKQLFVWDVRLSELAESIVKQRFAAIGLIKKRLSEKYSQISGKKAQLDINYLSLFNPKNYSAELMKALEKNLAADMARGFTGAGPHREDLSATINSTPVAITASRGETRTLLLALKIIEMELLEEKTGSAPLLLLDDVFSELDGSRRKALTNFLRKYQTIITTTDADIIMKNFSQTSQTIAL